MRGWDYSVSAELGADIGIQLSLHPGNLILEQQFAFLHAAECELVVQGIFDQTMDGEIEIAVLELQLA